MVAFKRQLYRVVLRLHPAAFRNRFAGEMALDFEDALHTYGFARLLADATGSLARQWTTEPISFARDAAAPIPLHPLLAGQYLDLDNDTLTPFEFFRGSLLFLVLLSLLGLALDAPGNRSLNGHLPGLPANHTDAFHRAEDGPFQPTPSERSRYPIVVRPNQNAVLRPGSTHYVVRGEGIPLPETWSGFLLRCALISAIIWVISFFMRRSVSIGARVALVALGLIAVFAAAAFVPVPGQPAHAQTLGGRLRLIDNSQPVRLGPLRMGESTPSFDVAAIRLSHPAAPLAGASDSAKAIPAIAGTPGLQSGDRIRITLPIRSFIASVCDMPAGSESRIVGGPAWLDSDIYDIRAKIDDATFAAMQQMQPAQREYRIELMEQSLLVTRFHLKAHEETRASRLAPAEPPVEVLVIDHIERPSEN